MTYLYFIGIDVGKDFFAAGRHDVPLQTSNFANDQDGFAAFLAAYADILPQSLVVLEATGGYEAGLLARLLAAGLAAHRADP